MSKTATVRARIEPDLKEEVEKLFHELGISTTDAINIFFKQVKLRHGLPFEVAIPNELTQKVLKETDDGKNIVRHENIDDMFKNLGI
ncbi:MAG: type II toxin-antitoxin system RelB/DinJ family antitoxin [Candidatus Aegiribacteria sp.]|nr:type II toxin-antitoxin system RelB/DinJ family antitoxin [Candidatus Aegiribacteria sp.]